MVSKRLVRQARVIANANVQAGMDAAVTIAARTHAMMAPHDKPSEKAREARLMVQEKFDAAVEGALAAQAAWNIFMVRAAFGGVRTADDITLGLGRVAKAAAAPAHRKVRANARRLTKTNTLPKVFV